MFARLLLALSMVALPLHAWAKDDFLKPEQAYRYSTRVDGDRLIVSWNIEPGYYLYRKRMHVASPTATVQVGEPEWPKGEDHTDEYFGTQEIYRGKVDVPVPLVFQGARPSKLDVELKLQGCADTGLCYPPQTWKTEVAVPPTSTSAADSTPGAGSAPTSLRSMFPSKSRSGQEEFLPPDDAFRFGASMLEPGSVGLTWVIADHYYLYRDRIHISTDTPNVQIGTPALP